MLKALSPKPEHQALDAGTGTGYSSAVLARLVGHVEALDENAKLIEQARRNWVKTGTSNVNAVEGAMKSGVAAKAPSDLIFVNGAAYDVPHGLAAQLGPLGKMAVIIKKPGETLGRAVMVQRAANGHISSHVLFEAAAHYLPGFEPQPAFLFA
jgi:protein-L-isoaspartate(D-aspartate) O-methyltransferase